MSPLLDAFWRAAAYCLHPRVILLSVLPLLLVGGIAALLGYFFWYDAVAALRSTLQGWSFVESMLEWLDAVGAQWLHYALAPLVLLAIAVPVVLVLTLLLVAVMMTPALVKLVAARRFPHLQQRHGASFWQSAAASIGCTLIALIALAISVPFWFIPPLVLILPPLIWGWLAYRVMAFDALAEHATDAERRTILLERRWPLLAMGVITGYVGAAPSLVWALGALALVFAPVFILVAVWLYTLVFAFSSLWFVHYALAALEALRAREGGPPPTARVKTPELPPEGGLLPFAGARARTSPR